MDGCETAEIGCNGEIGLIPMHDAIFFKQRNCAVAAIYHPDLVGNILTGSIEQMLPIRKPAAPGGAGRNARRYIAYLTTLQSHCEDITSATPWIAPSAGDISKLLAIR